MTISTAGIELIKKFEGCRLQAYKCLAAEQYYTIGYGHYGADVTPGMIITGAQAEALLRSDLKRFEQKVTKYDYIYKWTQLEFDALVSFCYNVGSIDGLTNKGTRSRDQIAEKFLSYNKSGGKVISGLVKRRKAEQELFLSGQEKIIKVDAAKFPTLRKGSRGEYVQILQTLLNKKGIRGGCLVVDGIFGEATLLSVIEFQAVNNLVKDGIVGPLSWGKILQ